MGEGERRRNNLTKLKSLFRGGEKPKEHTDARRAARAQPSVNSLLALPFVWDLEFRKREQGLHQAFEKLMLKYHSENLLIVNFFTHHASLEGSYTLNVG